MRGSSGGSRLRSSDRLPSTAISRLLKSCATPPVSWPIASTFCDWRSCASTRSRSAICSVSRSLACAAARCARRPARSSIALARCSASSPRRTSSSRARASYCRWRPRSAARTTLTSVVGWNGRSRNDDVAQEPQSRTAAGLRSGPPPRPVSRTKGKSDHAGCAASQRRERGEVGIVEGFLGHHREAGAVAASRPAAPARHDRLGAAGLAQQRRGERRVAATRRQDQRAFGQRGVGRGRSRGTSSSSGRPPPT